MIVYIDFQNALKENVRFLVLGYYTLCYYFYLFFPPDLLNLYRSIKRQERRHMFLEESESGKFSKRCSLLYLYM